MAAEFILITETAEITFGYFLHNVFGNLRVRWGAARIWIFFRTSAPLFVGFMQLQGNQW
jgi:hypothetical protein